MIDKDKGQESKEPTPIERLQQTVIQADQLTRDVAHKALKASEANETLLEDFLNQAIELASKRNGPIGGFNLIYVSTDSLTFASQLSMPNGGFMTSMLSVTCIEGGNIVRQNNRVFDTTRGGGVNKQAVTPELSFEEISVYIDQYVQTCQSLLELGNPELLDLINESTN